MKRLQAGATGRGYRQSATNPKILTSIFSKTTRHIFHNSLGIEDRGTSSSLQFREILFLYKFLSRKM